MDEMISLHADFPEASASEDKINSPKFQEKINAKNPAQDTVCIFGFKGTVSPQELIGENPPHPYLCTGHVGYSFDAGKTIYGFGPNLPPNTTSIDALKILADRKNPGAYLGHIKNDTEIFKQVAKKSTSAGGELDAENHVYVVKRQVPHEKFEEITSRHKEEQSFPTTPYAFPQKHPGYFNCATFPSELGIEIPEKSGILAKYMKAMEKQGEIWK